MAVAGASAKEALDDTLEAGRALGQRLNVLTEVANNSSDFCSEVLDAGAGVALEGQH